MKGFYLTRNKFKFWKWNTYGIRFWDSPEIGINYHWHNPVYRHNCVRELDFGKISLFFGGSDRSVWNA